MTPRWLGWWFLSIAAGFALLAVHRLILGEGPSAVALRAVVAAGFAILAWFQFRRAS